MNPWLLAMILEALLAGFAGYKAAGSVGGPKPGCLSTAIKVLVFVLVFSVIILLSLIVNAFIGIPLNAFNEFRRMFP